MALNKMVLLLLTGSLMVACSVSTSSTDKTAVEGVDENPAGKGFNFSESDTTAIRIADEVMMAMGGRKNWDKARYFHWNFFGSRKLLWDKWTGDVRIDFLKQNLNILMNVRSGQGLVFRNGEEISAKDSVTFYLERGKSIWINDSYWLVMPFKLKDSGVTLNHVRKDTTLTGEPSDVLQLTFKEVGDTPENKYEVWVSSNEKLVKQWAYYSNFADTVARFTLPWDEYQQIGDILLSSERGDRDLSEVQVLSEVPANIFNNVEVRLNY